MVFPDPAGITGREREEASNGYVLTLMTVMVGLPFPIINLIACMLYFFLIKSKSPFVRFHAFQAMTSQAFIIVMNSIALTWTLKVIFTEQDVTNLYLGYIITIVIFNLGDYIINIIAAVKARKGKMMVFTFFGTMAYMIYMKKHIEHYGEKAAA